MIRNHFYFKFEQEHFVPDYIKEIQFEPNNNTIYSNDNATNKSEFDVYHLQLVPSYLNLKYYEMDGLRKKIIPEHDMAGSGIYLGEHSSLSELVQNQLSKSFRKNLKRALERFEHCFDVKYVMYCGEIEKDNYETLMDKLREMYLLRFEQLGQTHIAVFTWGKFRKICYDLINSRKASLMVIYANNLPVDITLAFHYDKLFFSVVSAYDLNFSKFSLGHISIYKELEWCFEHNFMFYDLGHGAEMPYKQKWVNMEYQFQNQILYKKGSLQGFFGFLFALGYATLKNTLYKYSKLYLWYDKFKHRNTISKSLENISYTPYDYTKENIENFNTKGLSNINVSDMGYEHIQKGINDFLYAHRFKSNELTVYQDKQKDNDFFFVGASKAEKFSFFKI